MSVIGWKYEGPMPPGGRPIPGQTNLNDVEWALTKARRFIFKGGDPADIEEYLNVWLDYRAQIRGTSLEHVKETHELKPAPASEGKRASDGEGDLSVLGHCPHGFDLDREFCPHGCRV